MKKIICKRRYIALLNTCLIPSFIYAHAGIYDRYLSALPAYYALTSIPSGIFYGMHGLLLIGTVIYFLLHKFRDYNLPCIKMPRYAIHENVKLLITTILLSLVLTPVLFINKSFFGTVIVVIFVLSIIYFIAILFSKIRTLLVSKAYTCFLIATLALQSIYYACYYTFSLWENVTIKEWFKIVDEMVPGYPTTLYPEFVIPITELLKNLLVLSFCFIIPYLIYLLVYLCRFLISKKKAILILLEPMKKYLVIVFVLLSLCSCNKNITSDLPNVTSDSLMLTVMQSIMDTNRSYLDVKEELFMFIDTMQSHAEFHPDPEIRVGAKSFADLLAQLLLAPEFNTPEEMRFTIDSVIEPITDVRSTWYYQLYDDGHHSLSQHVLKYNEQTNSSDIVKLELIVDEEGEELLIVEMPNDKYHFTSLAFSGDSIFEIDSIGFYRADAKYINVDDNNGAEYVVFGSECIGQMLSHQALFIGYIDTDESKPLEERYQSSMHLLYKFKEQYAQYIFPIIRKAMNRYKL